jgi:hypothetical protein
MLTSVAMGFVSAICAGRCWPAAFQRMSSRFAADSPLEESGFEPSVPLPKADETFSRDARRRIGNFGP